jgi:hypothetical protein
MMDGGHWTSKTQNSSVQKSANPTRFESSMRDIAHLDF